MSYYGTPRAIVTPYGDLYFCISCATHIHLHKEARQEIYSYIRELDKNSIVQRSIYHLDDNEVHDFVTLVAQGKVKSWLGSDEPMKLLHEGLINEQSIIDASYCDCCMKAISDDCVDY